QGGNQPAPAPAPSPTPAPKPTTTPKPPSSPEAQQAKDALGKLGLNPDNLNRMSDATLLRLSQLSVNVITNDLVKMSQRGQLVVEDKINKLTDDQFNTLSLLSDNQQIKLLKLPTKTLQDELDKLRNPTPTPTP